LYKKVLIREVHVGKFTYTVHGNNDPYFYGKCPFNLHGRKCETELQHIFSVSSVANAEKQISILILLDVYNKKPIPLNNLHRAQTGWWFFVLQICHRHVKSDVSVYKPSVFFP